MANLMEEKILEIVKRNFEIRDGLINQAQKDVADEIADIFRKFTEWIGENGYYFDTDDNTWIIEDDPEIIRDTTDKLFDYWWNNIKDK